MKSKRKFLTNRFHQSTMNTSSKDVSFILAQLNKATTFPISKIERTPTENGLSLMIIWWESLILWISLMKRLVGTMMDSWTASISTICKAVDITSRWWTLLSKWRRRSRMHTSWSMKERRSLIWRNSTSSWTIQTSILSNKTLLTSLTSANKLRHSQARFRSHQWPTM